MTQKRYGFFIRKPNCGEELTCCVCNSRCKSMRNVFGPTGYISAMANKFTYHDEFVCPHSNELWHETAVRIAIAIDDTPSKRIAALMRADLGDILKENLR